METATESAAVKTVGLGSPSADRGGERESYDRSRQQQLAGHETLLLTFLIRIHHRIAGLCADARPMCHLGKTYLIFDRLRRDQRDTIWAYVARNLSRPLAYSAAGRDKPGSGSRGLGDPAAAGLAGLALLRRAHAEASRDPEELTRLH
jgi:hypothetical protein